MGRRLLHDCGRDFQNKTLRFAVFTLHCIQFGKYKAGGEFVISLDGYQM
jgi:hypothetical protein